MIDVVVYEKATDLEVDRIACHNEQEANDVLWGIRINMSEFYRATTMPHKEKEVTYNKYGNNNEII